MAKVKLLIYDWKKFINDKMCACFCIDLQNYGTFNIENELCNSLHNHKTIVQFMTVPYYSDLVKSVPTAALLFKKNK